jgi:glycolate oxidase iron-sulfur subunit
MLHSIPAHKHGPLAGPMTHAIETCVHCGFCLAACPTYPELGQEMDTPRGRIVLMKQVLEGTLEWQSAQPHIDRCLGCLACEPACPSGVPYRDLISPFRALAQQHVRRPLGARLRQLLTLHTITKPYLFRIAVRVGGLAKPFAAFLPRPLRPTLALLPDSIPPREGWPAVTPALGQQRARVALLLGCAQQVLEPDINTATIDVLTRNGVEVLVPQDQGCCGGLAWHAGNLGSAQKCARVNLAAFPGDVDAVLTNAAGCGSTLHEYHLILKGTSDELTADRFRKRVLDASVFLSQLGLREPFPAANRTLRAAYQDACHLANAQGVREQPRSLLRAIPGLELCELAGPELCCGSAGSYNIDQPEIASSLGHKKANSVIATGAELIVTGNIGCMVQLRDHLARLGSRVRVRHMLQVLRDAYEAN